MAANYLYVFNVRGFGRFPIDMLRYDRATPHHERDSTMIKNAMDIHHVPDQPTGYDVELQSNREPTQARWRSFGWDVTDVQKIRINERTGW